VHGGDENGLIGVDNIHAEYSMGIIALLNVENIEKILESITRLGIFDEYKRYTVFNLIS